MAEHYEELPERKGFPTSEDMLRWQAAFGNLIPGGNASELIGFRAAKTGEVMAVCRLRSEANA